MKTESDVQLQEIAEFIKLIQRMNQAQQAGVLLITQGARLVQDKKKKQRINRCFPS